MDQVPVVDLGGVIETSYSENRSEWSNVADNIRKCLGSIGFMQIVNHGVPQTIIDQVFEINKRFFDLNEADKLNYLKPNAQDMDSYFGYSKPGNEALGKSFEFRETYDWIEGRGIYPNEIIPNFNSLIEELHSHCKIVTKTLLKLIAISMKLDDEDFFVKRNKHWEDPKKFTGITNMKLMHYPKISKEANIPPDTVRIAEHTDFITITLLFQDDVGGLEVKTVDGEWIPAQPLAGGIVVNTGDLLEFWTNGLFQATPHRVPFPSEAKREIARYAVAFFNGPDLTETVTPLDIEKTPEEAKRLQKLGKVYSSIPVNAYEHVFRKVKSMYQ